MGTVVKVNHIADWQRRMIDAGWVFCPWLYNDGTIFVHADHNDARLDGKGCGLWVVFYVKFGGLPDIYHLNPEDPFYQDRISTAFPGL